jgi:hypothetical protein
MAKKKAAAKSVKKEREMLVVASKVKAFVKSKGMMTASDSLPALNECIYKCLENGLCRTAANKRSTLKPQDL